MHAAAPEARNLSIALDGARKARMSALTPTTSAYFI